MLAPLLLLAAMAPQTIPGPPHRSGAALFHACQADIRMMDSSTGGDDADIYPANECIEYVGGFVDAIGISGHVCFGDASTGTVIRVYVAYMQKNPKLLDESRGLGLFGAVLDAYPCPAK